MTSVDVRFYYWRKNNNKLTGFKLGKYLIYGIVNSTMLGAEVGEIDICDSCTKDNKIVFTGKVKQYDRTERTTSLCKECFRKGSFCAICFKKTH